MRELFSEETKRRMWRRLWLELATAQAKAGLVTEEELADLRRHVDAVDLAAAHEIEKEIHHDLMAELRVYARQAKLGGGKLHLGATSMDVEDNVETARLKQALSMLSDGLRSLLDVFAGQIEKYADLPCMAYTHLQAAEPTTLGYRMSLWAHDLYLDYENLKCLAAWLPSKGLRGAVGTSASYAALLKGSDVTPDQVERDVMSAFGLTASLITGQTYSRRLDYIVVANVAALAATASKFAFDVRVLASSPFGEVGEPFEAKQVGSSAMPFKRNPIMCERICSLARPDRRQRDGDVAERRGQPARTHARRFREPPLRAGGELFGRRRDRLAGEQGDERPTGRQESDRREPRHLRPVRRDRGGAHGGGAARRRPAGAAREAAGSLDEGLGSDREGREKPAAGDAVKG